jgi:D-alanyl-D-alanine carboxypeptidase (penicillin-binding protein 5/6)
MELAFREFRSYPVLKANQVVGNVPVLNGKEPSVPVAVKSALNVTMQVDSHAGMKTVVKPDANVTAPVQAGQKVGSLTVTAPEFPSLIVPVYAVQAVDKVGIFGSMMNSIQHLWKK